MNKDIIDRKLKAEINFFNIYAVFFIGLITGDLNLLLKYVYSEKPIILYLLIIGIILLIYTFVLLIKTYYSIKNLTKNK